jgi:hypothetical protein
MDAISFPVLGISQVTLKEFVRFWGRFYSTKYNEDTYKAKIGLPLTKKRTLELFRWKNGKPLSAAMTRTILRFLCEERFGPDFNAETLTKFLNMKGGAIWRIFWLHLQHPQRFPIYDQHVHRAMAFMLKWPDLEIPQQDSEKIRKYLEVYRPFFDSFDDCKQREVDRALWSFGRFLKSDYGRIFDQPIE